MERLKKYVFNIEEYSLAFMILLMMLLAFTQVVLRYIFGTAITWLEELIRYLMVYTTFFGAALGIKYKKHIKIEIAERIFSDRWNTIFSVLVSFVGIIYSLFVTYLSWSVAMKIKEFGQLSASLQVPVYLPYLIIPVASAIMIFRFIYQFFTSFKEASLSPQKPAARN